MNIVSSFIQLMEDPSVLMGTIDFASTNYK